MEIKQNLVNPNKYYIKCPYNMNYQYVTFHNTDNNAPAKNEVAYMISNNNYVSFHIAVDDTEAIQGIPLNRNVWACGDGTKGKGNRQSVSVEICYNALGANNPKFKKAEENAVKVCAKLLKDKGLGIDRLKPHKYWSGKNCPSTTNHADFIARVKNELNNIGKEENRMYKNLALYKGDVDKTIATVMSWGLEDCLVKDVDTHVAWEGNNVFTVGTPACVCMDRIVINQGNGKERFTKIEGKDRWETLKIALNKIGK